MEQTVSRAPKMTSLRSSSDWLARLAPADVLVAHWTTFGFRSNEQTAGGRSDDPHFNRHNRLQLLLKEPVRTLAAEV